MRVLVDGWTLVHDPGSPASMHICAMLASHPPEVQLTLALPGKRPTWIAVDTQTWEALHPDTPLNHLDWEQKALRQAAREYQADILHSLSQSGPLLANLPLTASPAGFIQEGLPTSIESNSLADRLRKALGRGGFSRARAVFMPDDLPSAPGGNHHLIPPLVNPEFTRSPAAQEAWAGYDLPETYVLYHGPYDRQSMERLLAAWSWAAGAIGTYYPLILYGFQTGQRERLADLLERVRLADSVILLETGSAGCGALYTGCSALFHPAPPSTWGDPVRQALACGKPIVASANPWSEALVGSAGYLAGGKSITPEEAARQLGAALITVIVEEQMAAELAQAAAHCAQAWQPERHWQALIDAWQGLLA
jgi:glycosyltransferase involved in cell wall biosynthesis